MAGTWNPACSSVLLRASAAASLPTTRGMMGLVTGTPRRVWTRDMRWDRCCWRQGSLQTETAVGVVGNETLGL